MSIEFTVTNQVIEVCPIDGISFGKLNDKATWRIDYKPEATDQQKQAAQSVIDNFVWDAATQQKDAKQQLIDKYKNDPLAKYAFQQYKQANPGSSISDFVTYLMTL